MVLWQFQIFLRTIDVTITNTTPLHEIRDPELIAPLFMVATRCRTPRIRRDALQTLKNLDRVEGPWHSSIAAQVAAHIILVEERGLGAVETCAMVPEESRIGSSTLLAFSRKKAAESR